MTDTAIVRQSPRTVAEIAENLEVTGDRAAPVPTGFQPLDTALEGGFRTRELAIIGGPPGIGKTAMALQWARHASSTGRACIFACYEHDEATLLGRLLAQEVGELSSDAPAHSSRTLATLRAVARGEARLEDRLAGDLRLRAAFDRLGDYAHRLWLVRASGIDTGLDELFEMADDFGPGTVLFVDYLQKVPNHVGNVSEVDRVAYIAEGLKELALDRDISVVAVVAGDETALAARRLRLLHLRGSAGLAYEADIVLMMNEKALAVSKAHSAYDALRAEQFQRQIVLSIDKNRGGPAPVDMEYWKDLAHYRIDPQGDVVQDRLIDTLLNPE